MTAEQAFQQAYALSQSYTKESLLGGGAVVGKNVIISSIDPIDGGNRITFSYTLDDGTVKTSTMDVMDGKDGSATIPPEYVTEDELKELMPPETKDLDFSGLFA